MHTYTLAMFALAALSASQVLALPAEPLMPRRGGFPHVALSSLTGCDISKQSVPLPSTAAAANMSIPVGQIPAFVALGRGVQNYTCTSGVFAQNMAIATLYDASCVVGTPMYTQITKLALATPRTATLPVQIAAAIGSVKLGDHYFQKLSSEATSANPVFDFRATKKGDYVAVSKLTSVPSPAGVANVAYVELTSVEGSLAKTVFRVETAGGQPPATCTTEGQLITVDYSALYWFYK